MKNKVNYVKSSEIEKIMCDLQNNDSIHVAAIDGEVVQHRDVYFALAADLFDFPTPHCGIYGYNWDSYSDWITDLDWLGKDGYALIIYNYGKFLSNDIDTKKLIIEEFEESILPWWEKDVEECVVEGKAKPFNVYLVD